jgi:membrane-associated phospholipid phosphatase
MKIQALARTRDLNVIPGLQRFLLIMLIVSVQMIYFPTSEQLTGGIEPKLPIDGLPLMPVWVVPYLLCYPLWLFALLWAGLKMDDRMFRSFVAAALLTCTFAVSIFVFFPTYVRASVIPGSDVFSSALRFIHENWGRYDAFPSGHIYITVLLAMFYNRWYPQHKFYWILISIIVSLSTLFTHQHYVADLIGGLAIAVLGYHLGERWAGLPAIKSSISKTRHTRPRS